MKDEIIKAKKNNVTKAVTDTLNELAKRNTRSSKYAYALLIDTFADLLKS